MDFDVLFDSEVISTAYVDKKGLYYTIHISCDLPAPSGYVHAVTEKGEIPVGKLLPDGEKLRIDKTLSASVLGKEIKSFIISDAKSNDMKLVEVREDAPFPYLHLLEYCRLKNGSLEIVYPKADCGM